MPRDLATDSSPLAIRDPVSLACETCRCVCLPAGSLFVPQPSQADPARTHACPGSGKSDANARPGSSPIRIRPAKPVCARASSASMSTDPKRGTGPDGSSTRRGLGTGPSLLRRSRRVPTWHFFGLSSRRRTRSSSKSWRHRSGLDCSRIGSERHRPGPTSRTRIRLSSSLLP